MFTSENNVPPTTLNLTYNVKKGKYEINTLATMSF